MGTSPMPSRGPVDVAQVAQRLAVPVVACVVRPDTHSPAFHGCVDWHSAVHGNYALRVATRLTGDPRFLRIAEAGGIGTILER